MCFPTQVEEANLWFSAWSEKLKILDPRFLKKDSLLEQKWLTRLLAGILVVQVIVLMLSLKHRDRIVEYTKNLPGLIQDSVFSGSSKNNRPRPFE